MSKEQNIDKILEEWDNALRKAQQGIISIYSFEAVKDYLIQVQEAIKAIEERRTRNSQRDSKMGSVFERECRDEELEFTLTKLKAIGESK